MKQNQCAYKSLDTHYQSYSGITVHGNEKEMVKGFLPNLAAPLPTRFIPLNLTMQKWGTSECEGKDITHHERG